MGCGIVGYVHFFFSGMKFVSQIHQHMPSLHRSLPIHAYSDIYILPLSPRLYFSLSQFLSLIQAHIYKYIYLTPHTHTHTHTLGQVYTRWSPRGVGINVLNCDIVVNKFKLQLGYWVHFWTNTPGKR